ncbi:MAG: NrfD/PsrC family molybdoenzyme membrane anchor subunit [Thermomicrobiaceae bacterium]
MLRDNPIGWNWEVYIEMFAVGIAAGAFLIAMLLELFGRGRSPIARTAHLITPPLALLGTALLIYKLERSERFLHMIVQSENIPWPMFKWWSPISFGAWILMAFSLVATISFIDALVDRSWFRAGPWYRGHTIHGSILGKVVAVIGILLALALAAYSGALLSVTAVPGWDDTIFISALFLGVSAATGAAMLLLLHAIFGHAPLDEVDSLTQFGSMAVIWQLFLLIVVAISLGGAMSFILSSTRTIIAAAVAVVLLLIALPILYLKVLPSDTLRLGLASSLILVSGFLIRYTMVMGPQHAIE